MISAEIIILAPNPFVWNRSFKGLVYFGDFTDFCFSVFLGGSAITNAEAMQIWRYGAFCWMRRMG